MPIYRMEPVVGLLHPSIPPYPPPHPVPPPVLCIFYTLQPQLRPGARSRRIRLVYPSAYLPTYQLSYDPRSPYLHRQRALSCHGSGILEVLAIGELVELRSRRENKHIRLSYYTRPDLRDRNSTSISRRGPPLDRYPSHFSSLFQFDILNPNSGYRRASRVPFSRHHITQIATHPPTYPALPCPALPPPYIPFLGMQTHVLNCKQAVHY